MALDNHLKGKVQEREALEQLQKLLQLPQIPNRIEGFDISNTMGTNSVASMVVWEDGRMIDLGTPSGSGSEANAINDAGQIVGMIDLMAFLWEDGVWTELGTLPGHSLSGASDINTAGEVVGGRIREGSPREGGHHRFGKAR